MTETPTTYEAACRRASIMATERLSRPAPPHVEISRLIQRNRLAGLIEPEAAAVIARQALELAALRDRAESAEQDRNHMTLGFIRLMDELKAQGMKI